MKSPVARKDTTVEMYHGHSIADPYRWLEDASSPETVAWTEAQNAVARGYLDAILQRQSIQQRLTELMNYPRYSVPHKEGERYYFSKNSGLQNQGVLYMQQTLASEPQLVLDPNLLSSDGTVALTNQAYSHDGTLLAYGTSASGSDWQELRIRRIDEGSDFDEVIHWCKFSSVAWRHDGQGFYYNRFPEPTGLSEAEQTYNNKVYWHQIGTSQDADRLIFERPDDQELAFDPIMSEDGRYLLLNVWCGTDPKNRFYYRPLESDAPFVRLLDEADASYAFIGNDGNIFYFNTDLEASRGRIIAIDINQPEREHWRELIAEQEEVIAFVVMVNHQFVVAYLHDAHHELRIYHTNGSADGEIVLPTLGSLIGISGRAEESELFIGFTSYLYPPSTFRYDFHTHILTPLHTPSIAFDPAGYETEQVFYPSKDGTRVPMFLTHKKGLVLDGNNSVLLYGYGGFNVSLTPSFSTSPLLWIEHGGIYAVANLRGGNEYGEDWHQAGMLAKKQNVFDDFIAAGEWLIENNYTSSKRLAIYGGSNGGLLVGACLVQRPELYGAAVCAVPVLDMLRYHRFTVGRYWIPEYGNAEQSAEDFQFLSAYSPLHNIKEAAYPATLILTADTDDRVVPAHAKKFYATIYPANTGSQPILLRVELKAGHGLGKPISKVIEESSDMLAFLFKIFEIA